MRLDPDGGEARSNLVHAAAVLGRPLPPEAQVPVAAAAVAPTSSSAAPEEATMEGPSEAQAAKIDSPAAAPAKADAPLKSTPAVLAPQRPQPKAKP